MFGRGRFHLLSYSMFEVPSRTDITRCVIDRAVVMDRVHPTLITTDEGERRSA